MHFSRLKIGFILGSLGFVALSQASSFDGVGLNDTWPTSGWGSSADWTSDLGLDYRCGWGTNATNTVMTGDGTGWSNRPLAYGFDAGFDLGWQLNKKGGGAGDTFSGGDAHISEAGPLDTSISRMHLFSELGENSPGLGIETGSYIVSTMGCSLDYAWQPIYYAMDWEVTYSGTGEVIGDVSLNGFGWDYQPGRSLFNGFFSGSGTVSGTSFGTSNRYASNGAYNLPLFSFTTYLRDYAGAAGSGRLDATVSFRFSDQPIQTVPEPATFVVLGLGLIPFMKRRRK